MIYADGVSLAAIQVLYRMIQLQFAQLELLNAKVEQLLRIKYSWLEDQECEVQVRDSYQQGQRLERAENTSLMSH